MERLITMRVNFISRGGDKLLTIRDDSKNIETDLDRIVSEKDYRGLAAEKCQAFIGNLQSIKDNPSQ